jgi:GDP-D-mannose 3',5'-epimerase
MESDFSGPVNVGSAEMIIINGLAETVTQIPGERLGIRQTSGLLGFLIFKSYCV